VRGQITPLTLTKGIV